MELIVDVDDMIKYVYNKCIDNNIKVSIEEVSSILEFEEDYLIKEGIISEDVM